MKWIIVPIVAVIAFIIKLIWSFNYRKARLLFRDIIDPEGFHTLDN